MTSWLGTSVKVCISSRPEPFLQSRLGQHPQLRLQDLVFRDIRMYAYRKLSQAIAGDPGSSLDRHRLATIVSERAQGVFLWAMLAVQSLVRGIEHGDDENCLQERLGTLSGKLEDFYLDMWNSYNDELPSYRRTAARYLNLMIIAPHCLEISTSGGVTPVRLDMT